MIDQARTGLTCESCGKMYGDFGKDTPCETCPAALLSAEDHAIWNLYCAINTQFTYDFHALPLIFEVHGVSCTRREAADLLHKLSLIHDWYVKHKKS